MPLNQIAEWLEEKATVHVPLGCWKVRPGSSGEIYDMYFDNETFIELLMNGPRMVPKINILSARTQSCLTSINLIGIKPNDTEKAKEKAVVEATLWVQEQADLYRRMSNSLTRIINTMGLTAHS